MNDVQDLHSTGLRSVHWSELKDIERPPYLIKGWLGANSLAVLYGKPGALKSFLTLDLSMHVAQGKHWHGHRVHGGPVIYVALEGGAFFLDRLTAFEQHFGVERKSVPFYWLDEQIFLGDPADDQIGELIAEVQRIDAKLVVIDTLNRALVGGNENSPEGMGNLVACVTAIQKQADAAVLLIHHSGKDESRGARGHSSLLAAVDTELHVEKHDDGLVTVRASKQRHLPDDAMLSFLSLRVELGTDEDGDPVASLVLEPTEKVPPPKDNLPTGAKKALDLLWQEVKADENQPAEGELELPPGWRATTEERWHAACDGVLSKAKEQRYRDRRFREAKELLAEVGLLGERDGWVWPVAKTKEAEGAEPPEF